MIDNFSIKLEVIRKIEEKCQENDAGVYRLELCSPLINKGTNKRKRNVWTVSKYKIYRNERKNNWIVVRKLDMKKRLKKRFNFGAGVLVVFLLCSASIAIQGVAESWNKETSGLNANATLNYWVEAEGRAWGKHNGYVLLTEDPNYVNLSVVWAWVNIKYGGARYIGPIRNCFIHIHKSATKGRVFTWPPFFLVWGLLKLSNSTIPLKSILSF